MNNKVEIIAFYLPQYHPFKENDEWWGKGFTEWTNVGKAKPLFKGHNQPRVPTELGYYDLRLPIIREQQAQMARDAGVTAFCYWHYWFGNGKRLIPEVFQEVLESGKPNFPFCLGWANHSWFAKNWNSDGTTKEKLLMEQTYPGIKDAKMHFDFLIKAFKDERYVKIDGKPLLYIFDPVSLPSLYVENFRKWARESGFSDLYLVARISCKPNEVHLIEEKGFDAYSYERLGTMNSKILKKFGRIGRFIYYHFYIQTKGFIIHRPPRLFNYKKYYKQLITDKELEENVIPTIVPQWDHSPRSGWNGQVFINATPDYFYLHAKHALQCVNNKKHKLIFLKSWNEWGEGNMMEPDLTYGRGFIDALRKAIKDNNDENTF